MAQLLETNLNQFMISTDPSRLDVDAITDLLTRAYWAQGRTREMIARYLQHSLTFGLYDGSRQIGLARVVSDYTTFAWLCDKWLIETVHSHPDLQGLRRWMLATKDAHGLYSQFGWVPLEPPERWMMKIDG